MPPLQPAYDLFIGKIKKSKDSSPAPAEENALVFTISREYKDQLWQKVRSLATDVEGLTIDESTEPFYLWISYLHEPETLANFAIDAVKEVIKLERIGIDRDKLEGTFKYLQRLKSQAERPVNSAQTAATASDKKLIDMLKSNS